LLVRESRGGPGPWCWREIRVSSLEQVAESEIGVDEGSEQETIEEGGRLKGTAGIGRSDKQFEPTNCKRNLA